MSGMTLYWPKSGREISTLRQGYFEDSFWENNKESQWKSANKQEIFYMRRRTVEWRGEDQEVWLVLRMDQDFLYEIKEMAAGMDQGGSNFNVWWRNQCAFAEICGAEYCRNHTTE